MISLGLMEAFSRHSSRVGYFRPVVASRQDADNTIELIRRRYDLAQSYEQSYGITTARTRGVGSLRDADGLISEIMSSSTAWPRNATSCWSKAPTTPAPAPPSSSNST